MATVLYLTYDGLTDPLGQSQIIPYLKGLSGLGHSITILSTEKIERFNQKSELIKDMLSKADIRWEYVFYHKNPPIFSTLLDLYHIEKKARVLSNRTSFDIVHCRSYLSSLIGLRLKNRFETKFIFDMRGFWADERVDGNLWNLKNPLFKWIYSYFKKKEQEFLLKSDTIVSLTQAGRLEMEKWPNGDHFKNKIKVIPCCVDTELFDPTNLDSASIKAKREELAIDQDEFILTYLGSIGTWYMLSEMLQFFQVLQKNKKKAKFLFITPLTDHATILSSLSDHHLSVNDVRIIESDRQDVPLYLSLSNYSIFFIKPSYSKISSSPTKQGEIMAMGIPVICNDGVGDTSSIVSTYQSGISLAKMENTGFEKAIEVMETKDFEKKHLRSGAIDYFSLKAGILKYHEIYSALTLFQ